MLKNIFIDSLNGFAVKDIPLFLFQMLVAGLLGLIIQKMVNRKFDQKIISNGSLIALAVALIVAITKNSLPFAVLAAAVIILLGMRKTASNSSVIGLFLIVAVGVGCGVGSVIQTVIGAALICAVLLFLPLKDEAEQA